MKKNLGDVRKVVEEALKAHNCDTAIYSVCRRFRKGYPNVCDILVCIDDYYATNGVTDRVWDYINKFWAENMNNFSFTSRTGKVNKYNAIWLQVGFLNERDFTA